MINDPRELRHRVGQELGISDWRVVTQEMIDGFANITGDRQWIHVDAQRAKHASPFGSTIAHGFLTLALISQLHAESVQIGGVAQVLNYGLNRVRFPAPVRAGGEIRSHSVLQGFEEKDGSVQATWQITVEIKGASKPAMVAEWVLRLFPE